MKKIITITLISLITCCCTRDDIDFEFQSILKNALIGHKNCFKLIGMSFEWDSLLILNPYTIPNRLKMFDSFELKQIEKSGIQERDDINLIIFYHRGKVEETFKAPVEKYDLSKLKYLCFYDKSSQYSISIVPSNSIYVLHSCE